MYQVILVRKGNGDLKAFPECVLIYLDLLVSVEKKETEDHQEILVHRVMMVFLDHKDLKENAAYLLHKVKKVHVATQDHLVKMANKEIQEYLV